MPTLSYFLSSFLLVSPFAIAAIIEVSEHKDMPDKTYGEWLALIFTFVTAIVILRILYKEVTIANVIEASKKFRISKEGIDTSLEESEEGYSVIEAVSNFFKVTFNIPGWILSTTIFPRDDKINLLRMILYFVLLGVFSYYTAESFYGDSAGSIFGLVAGVYAVAIVFLFIVGPRTFSGVFKPESGETEGGEGGALLSSFQSFYLGWLYEAGLYFWKFIKLLLFALIYSLYYIVILPFVLLWNFFGGEVDPPKYKDLKEFLGGEEEEAPPAYEEKE